MNVLRGAFSRARGLVLFDESRREAGAHGAPEKHEAHSEVVGGGIGRGQGVRNWRHRKPAGSNSFSLPACRSLTTVFTGLRSNTLLTSHHSLLKPFDLLFCSPLLRLFLLLAHEGIKPPSFLLLD